MIHWLNWLIFTLKIHQTWNPVRFGGRSHIVYEITDNVPAAATWHAAHVLFIQCRPLVPGPALASLPAQRHWNRPRVSIRADGHSRWAPEEEGTAAAAAAEPLRFLWTPVRSWSVQHGTAAPSERIRCGNYFFFQINKNSWY